MGAPDFDRLPSREDPQRVPLPGAERGLFVVDATWGEISPIEIAEGVRTVGELELMAHVRAGLPLVDTRPPEAHAEGSIATARNLPHGEIEGKIGSLDADRPTIFFCNGPQCTATPDAIEVLIRAGHPPEAILFYRGGMHDWVTLGLPVSVPVG